MNLRESRRALRGDQTVPCQGNCVRPHPDTGLDWWWQCVKLNGHAGDCELRPLEPNVPTPEIARMLGGVG